MERIVNLDPFKESMPQGNVATEAMMFEERYTHAFGMPLGEEIVRCKDCVFWYGAFMHPPHCEKTMNHTGRMDFCSWGERREK